MKVTYGPEFEASLKKLVHFEKYRKVNPKEWYRQTKWFIQRGRRGYSDQDLWGAYYHIAETVTAFIDMQKSHGMGYPMGLSGPKEWNEILSEIRWLMGEVTERTNTPWEVMKTQKYQRRRKRAERLFAQYWQNMWD